jgi:hypothetical protein
VACSIANGAVLLARPAWVRAGQAGARGGLIATALKVGRNADPALALTVTT